MQRVELTRTVRVSLLSLQRALTAVTPHAETGSTGDVSALTRVRWIIADDELHIVAANGVTAALGAVHIIDEDDGLAVSSDADMSPRHASKIASLFASADIDSECAVTFTHDGITVADVSGLWPGQSATWPKLPRAQHFPDIGIMLRRALSGASRLESDPLATSWRGLQPFRHAAAAYGHPLLLEPFGIPGRTGLVVLCGSDFAGLTTRSVDDADSTARRQAIVDTHRARHATMVTT